MSITKYFALKFSNYENPNSLVSRIRYKRIKPLLDLIFDTHKKYGFVSIVDIGGTESYWNMIPLKYLIEHNVTITLVNLPHPDVPADHGIFKFLEADGCNLFEIYDKQFHIAHSNSVIEHVGDWSRMKQFSIEFNRIAKTFFIQTPSFWFPIEPHFMMPIFHWLPRPTRVYLVSKYQLGHWKMASSIDEAVQIVETARLLNHKMFSSLFPNAEISVEKIFGISKSYVAVQK